MSFRESIIASKLSHQECGINFFDNMISLEEGRENVVAGRIASELIESDIQDLAIDPDNMADESDSEKKEELLKDKKNKLRLLRNPSNDFYMQKFPRII